MFMSIPSNPLNPRYNAIASHTFYPVVPIWVVFWILSYIVRGICNEILQFMSITFSPVQFLYQVCPHKLDIFVHLLPMHIYFPFHNLECQKSVFYSLGISYLFDFSAGQCAFDLDNCNDSYVGIGIVHLCQHILYLCQN